MSFKTSAVAETDASEGGMFVQFVPMAPNPVMGELMVCIADVQVQNIDMSVQDEFQG